MTTAAARWPARASRSGRRARSRQALRLRERPSGVGSPTWEATSRSASLPAGEVRLEVNHPDYPPSFHGVTTGTFANLTVPFPGGIAGEVKAKSTGAAVGRGRLEATGPGGAKASADVRRDGTFRLLRLVPGHWRVNVVAAGFHNTERELDVPASSNLGEASIRDLRLELDGS